MNKLLSVPAILLFLVAASKPMTATTPTAGGIDQATLRSVDQTMQGLPLRFEENSGRFDATVKYLARGQGYTLFLTPTETVLTLQQNQTSDNALRQPRVPLTGTPSFPKARVVRVRLEDSNRITELHGEGEFSAPTAYLLGNDPSKWRTATNYQRVRCESVYPGVDLIYYGNQGELEYDFELAPEADPNRIALRYSGVRRLRVEADGTLVLKLKGGELRQHPPVAYQMIEGERREVSSRYLVKGKRTVGFTLGDYDASRPLVIDPVLSYSTYLGGGNTDLSNSITVDSSGNAYVTGRTNSIDFPTRNQYQTNQVGYDAFITKLNTKASGPASLLYSTYLGGGGNDFGNSIAVDSAGRAYITGTTDSVNFPTLHQFQTNQTADDAFVAKFDTNVGGTGSLLYSTYLGGNDDDTGSGIAADANGNAYVTGATKSTNFPTLRGYQADQGVQDVYVTKLDTNASGMASLVYSTYLGGAATEFSGGIKVDSSGNAYITGGTSSIDFPTRNAFQASAQAGTNAFVAKLNPNLSGAASLLYSTYLGGNDMDVGNGIAVDSRGNAYVTGYTGSSNFPTRNQYQTDQPSLDVFVTKLNTEASGPASLLYSTYLGGDHIDFGNAIAVDSAQNVYVTGETFSMNFPTLHPNQINSDCDGSQQSFDAFVTVLKTNASGAGSFLYSTYLGSDMSDVGYGIAVDRARNAYVTGATDSATFPLFNQYQTNQVGGDAFVSKFNLALHVPAPLRADFDANGSSDILWQNNSTGARAIWIMNGTTFTNSVSLGSVSIPWNIVGSGDFNGDGHSDILWQNNSTGARAIWIMNGTAFSGNSVSLGTVSTSWNIVGTGDFNADGELDILWQNTSTGARAIWIMNGTAFSGNSVSLGTVSTPWNIVAAEDFNGDGKPDILWENSATGERVIWVMNGTVHTSTVGLGIVSTPWEIGGAGDFSGDGKPDILWQNSATGERVIWLMNGTAHTSTVSLGIVSTPWEIENY